MTEIPFHKLHGAENDFLLTWESQVPLEHLPERARRICARHTGIGADGWMLVGRGPDLIRIRLFNSDGSEAEISGNGTRCAAAFALLQGVLEGPEIVVETGAGPKRLRVLHSQTPYYEFEMDMGQPDHVQLDFTPGNWGRTSSGENNISATALGIGNPQCVVFTSSLSPDWVNTALAIQADPRFPRSTNVSFVRVLDRHTLEVVFVERGAGVTRSSGTGSAGAFAAAFLRKMIDSPAEVRTPAGSLALRWDDHIYLAGPAELVATGTYFDR